MDFKSFRREAVLIVVVIIGVMIYRAIKSGGEITENPLPIALIPAVSEITTYGDEFSADEDSRIYWHGEEAEQEAVYLRNWLSKESLNLHIEEVDPAQEPDNRIALRIIEEPGLGEEGYMLSIGSQGIEIAAFQPAGLYYGIQSLKQLRSEDNRWPGLQITDVPAFKWRGMLLDCCRHFMEPDFIKRYIDLLAFHKMNVLHWHLTEDQGWRIEIDAYPKLTEIGAWRTEADGSRYGGYYTKDQIRDIVAYAAERYVTVVPEIEMPGHSQAAVAAYPEISCTGGPHAVWNDWGVSREVYCVGNEKTFQFLETVLAEVMELFPSEYIHIGGDEAPTYRWEHCSKCVSKVREMKLSSAHELQPYMLGRINDFLRANGKTMIGWDEIADGILPEGAIVQSWRGFEGAEKAVASGHEAIVSPTSHAYFDYGLDAINLERVFQFDPIPTGLEKGRDLILGAECNMWTEHAPQETVDSKVFPRILAMADVLWAGPGSRSFELFQQDLKVHYLRLDALGVNYGAEDVPLQFVSNASVEGWVDLHFESTADDVVIYFGRGVFDPDTNDVAFEEGAHLSLLDGDQTISARAFRNGKPYGNTVQRSFSVSMATGKTPELKWNWSDAYPAGGEGALTDGRLGTLNFRDGNWQGFRGTEDIVATIDLGSDQLVDSVSCGFYQYNNAWIFLPEKMTVYGGLEEGNLKKIGSISNVISPEKRGQFREMLTCAFEKRQARYIRVVAESIGECPAWHEAAGSEAWLFADEIIIR